MTSTSEKIVDDLPTAGVDLTHCDLEPITRLDLIQPFGFLLAMTNEWLVIRASANLRDFLKFDADVAIGMKLDAMVDAERLHEIRNRLTGLASSGGTERLYGIELVAGGPRLDIAIHHASDTWILEGEPAGLDNRLDAASLVRKLLSRLNKQANLDAFHGDAVRQIRALTGFQRVMIYRFSADGAGEVIAESCAADIGERFLGLHYPATDIPVQARALYLRNPFRIIADVHAATVPILAAPSLRGTALDLSQAMTRAVSAVHIEYLCHMGVGASLSISIIIDGALWGLIACHHSEPRLPTFVVRTAVELFGQMYSMTLESRLRNIEDAEESLNNDAIARLLTSVRNQPALLTDAQWLLGALRPIIQCDGIATSCGGKRSFSGVSLNAEEIDALLGASGMSVDTPLVTTDNIAALNIAVLNTAQALGERPAGVLCIPLLNPPNEYLLLFRREWLHEIRWAGEHAKHVVAGGANVRLSPRTSFAAFTEAIAGRSRTFTPAERHAAEMLRSGLMNLSPRGASALDAEQQLITQRQELLIAELNHRVRNVLALIRGLISQTNGEAGDATSYVKSLKGRVQALARAHDRVTRQNWGPGLLNVIFEDEISAYVPARRNRFTIHGDGIFLLPQAYSACALIIHELVTNSSKYGSLSDNGRIEVTLKHVEGQGLHFKWRELDGPVVAKPTRRGFGSVIIERVVPFDLQGTASIQYLPTGLLADFFIPERHIAAPPAFHEHGIASVLDPLLLPTSADLPRPLTGRKVLLLEDNLIVALEAEDLLKALGAAEVCTASTINSAVSLLEEEMPHFAVLDVNLGFENSLTFSERLRDAGVPFIFTSGYGEKVEQDATNRRVITVSKPYDRDQLGRAIELTLSD